MSTCVIPPSPASLHRSGDNNIGANDAVWTYRSVLNELDCKGNGVPRVTDSVADFI